ASPSHRAAGAPGAVGGGGAGGEHAGPQPARGTPAPEDPAGPGGHPDAEAGPDLDADQVRARMASLQRGWRLGRQQTDPGRNDTPPARP
ncbi:hypothetical protein RM780_23550, partial [Streptomyces sp. DSM 44917]